MSNGGYGHGDVAATMYGGDRDIKGRISVETRWSSSANWIELGWSPDDAGEFTFTLAVDAGNDEAVALTAKLLGAIDEEDMGTQLLNESQKLAERYAARELADAAARDAKSKADSALLAATAAQRAAYEAELERIEAAYASATGEPKHYGRSLHWSPASVVADWGVPF